LIDITGSIYSHGSFWPTTAPRGDQHLFADASLDSYDADAAALLLRRVLDFLRAR